MQKVVLATGNAGKVAELATELADTGLHIIAQSDLGIGSIDETGLTFIENGLIKARHAAQLSGLPAIADDSGLVVHALNGAPGIFSARYGGKEGNANANMAKLLHEMRAVASPHRGACFYCTLVYLRHAEDPMPIICHGRWPGTIAQQAAGSGGFGYDPLFFLPDEGCTAAELSAERKRALSHRGQALRQLLQALLDEKST